MKSTPSTVQQLAYSMHVHIFESLELDGSYVEDLTVLFLKYNNQVRQCQPCEFHLCLLTVKEMKNIENGGKTYRNEKV